jgi:hypothetical protein
MHASIMQLDPNQAAKQWVAYTSDTMQLLVLHELEPQIAAPLLSAHITHVIGWLLAFYYFNTNGEASSRACCGQHGHRPAEHALLSAGSHAQAPPLEPCSLWFSLCLAFKQSVICCTCAWLRAVLQWLMKCCADTAQSASVCLPGVALRTVAFQLHNVNLLTRKSEPPPDNHWQHAFEAADMTQQQRQQIALANQFCEARLRQLQLEQQQLLQQMAKLHKGGGSDEEGGEAPSLAATTQPGTPSFSAGFDDVVEEGTVSLEVPLGPAAVAFSAGIKVEEAAAALAPAVLAGGTDIKTAGGSLVPSSVATDAGTDVFAWGPSSDGGSSGSSSGSGSGSGSASPRDSSNHARQHLLAKASELTQKISANCSAWRTLTSMRAQYSAAVLTPLQLARMMTAAAPYLLIGAPM